MIKNYDSIKRDFLKYIEYQYVMSATDKLFEGGPIRSNTSNESLSRIFESYPGRSVGIIAGVVLQEKLNAFETVTWRLCQGNVFFNHLTIPHKTEDPDTGSEVLKAVFYAVYQGDNLESKLLKLCEGYKATVYNCPETQNERIAIKTEISIALIDLQKIVAEASRQRKSSLELAARNVLCWEKMIRKAKATYYTMNKYQPDRSHKVFIAQFWIPACRMNDLHQVLKKNQKDMLMKPILLKIDTDEIPPTYHDLNKFTQVFQDLLDAYGANTYQEHNPAPYYIVTFPFLFSIMFGDAGHGAIMTLFALFLIATEKNYLKKKISGEIMSILYSGRYMIFLMGLFSIQSGILYNDIFSLSVHIFQSSWKVQAYDQIYSSEYINKTYVMLDPEINYEAPPYPIGLDPIWAGSKNFIVIKNSLKMKMSIIIGVIHMTFGLILNLNNILFFKRYSDIISVFIPELLFLTSLFVYLAALILLKWLLYGPGKGRSRSAGCAPSILNTFIAMILFTKHEAPPDCEQNMYPYQGTVQLGLIINCMICIPWLFLVKPLLLIHRKNKGKKGHSHTIHFNDNSNVAHHSNFSGKNYPGYPKAYGDYYDFCERFGQDEKLKSPKFPKFPQRKKYRKSDFESINTTRGGSICKRSISGGPKQIQCGGEDESGFFDIFTHQAIHTIEFLLGTVSNTASYLRLWALSLAHQQLSEVVWEQVLNTGLGNFSNYPLFQPIFLYFIFIAWAALSVAILVLMEGLSAFLHTLRLHWIEFQSKFYDGNGRIFTPFHFSEILSRYY